MRTSNFHDWREFLQAASGDAVVEDRYPSSLIMVPRVSKVTLKPPCAAPAAGQGLVQKAIADAASVTGSAPASIRSIAACVTPQM